MCMNITLGKYVSRQRVITCHILPLLYRFKSSFKYITPIEPHNNLAHFMFIVYPTETVPGKIQWLVQSHMKLRPKIRNLTPSPGLSLPAMQTIKQWYQYVSLVLVSLWDYVVAVTIPGRTIFVINYYKYPTQENLVDETCRQHGS